MNTKLRCESEIKSQLKFLYQNEEKRFKYNITD